VAHRFALRVFLALAFAAGASTAGAVGFPVTGSLSLTIATLPSISAPVNGTAIVNGSGAGGHLDQLSLPAGIAQATHVVLPLTDPGVSPLRGIQLTVGNAPGAFAAGGGIMPLTGVAKVCLFTPCSTAETNLQIPLGVVGAGGAQTVSVLIDLTVIGAPWTTGTAVNGSLTQMGFAHGPGSNMSSTAAASGQINLVTPIFVTTNVGSSMVIPAFAVLSLHFVPEPTTLVLIGGGLGLLATAGRRRMRR